MSIDDELANLPSPKLDDMSRARVLKKAHDELAATAPAPWWQEVAARAAIAVVVVGYLGWAFLAAKSLYGP
jgi:hypothetical protein